MNTNIIRTVAGSALGAMLLTCVPMRASATDSDTGTLLVGETVYHCIPSNHISGIYGFIGVIGTGSYSPTGLTGGDTVYAIEDVVPGNCSVTFSALTVSGFSSNPGSTWLSFITCNGVKLTEANAIYAYSSGEAEWQWSTLFGLMSKNSDNISCTIVQLTQGSDLQVHGATVDEELAACRKSGRIAC